jgi:hypothetical protein
MVQEVIVSRTLKGNVKPGCRGTEHTLTQVLIPAALYAVGVLSDAQYTYKYSERKVVLPRVSCTSIVMWNSIYICMHCFT